MRGINAMILNRFRKTGVYGLCQYYLSQYMHRRGCFSWSSNWPNCLLFYL